MKILYVDIEVLSRDKLLELIIKDDGASPFYVGTMKNSPSVAEGLLKDNAIYNGKAEGSKDSTEENKYIIIVNPEKGKLNNHLNFDFKKSGLIEYKNFIIDVDHEVVTINNKRIKLTTLEYRLLLFFIHNTKKLISRQDIMEYLWGKTNKPQSSDNTMYTHIKNLKKKIFQTGVGNFIHSIYGQGYKFEGPEDVVL